MARWIRSTSSHQKEPESLCYAAATSPHELKLAPKVEVVWLIPELLGSHQLHQAAASSPHGRGTELVACTFESRPQCCLPVRPKLGLSKLLKSLPSGI